MNIQVEKLEALTVFIVCDKLVPSDFESVLNAIEEGFENVILDFGNCSSIENSDDLDCIETLQESRDELDKSLVLCGLSSELLEQIEVKFDEDFFNIVPTRNEAVDMVYMEEQERSFFS